MLKIISHKVAQRYPGGHLEPHLQPPEDPYEVDDTETIEVYEDESETGRPYRVQLKTHSRGGHLDSAEVIEMEPVNPGDWEAIPDMSSEEWLARHKHRLGKPSPTERDKRDGWSFANNSTPQL